MNEQIRGEGECVVGNYLRFAVVRQKDANIPRRDITEWKQPIRILYGD